MAFDVEEILHRIISDANMIIDTDITRLRGFSKNQLKALVKHTEIITRAIKQDDIDEDLQEFFFDSLENMALNFVKTINGLLIITIEKVWNAIVNVLWDSINSVLNLNLITLSSKRYI